MVGATQVRGNTTFRGVHHLQEDELRVGEKVLLEDLDDQRVVHGRCRRQRLLLGREEHGQYAPRRRTAYHIENLTQFPREKKQKQLRAGEV